MTEGYFYLIVRDSAVMVLLNMCLPGLLFVVVVGGPVSHQQEEIGIVHRYSNIQIIPTTVTQVRITPHIQICTQVTNHTPSASLRVLQRRWHIARSHTSCRLCHILASIQASKGNLKCVQTISVLKGSLVAFAIPKYHNQTHTSRSADTCVCIHVNALAFCGRRCGHRSGGGGGVGCSGGSHRLYFHFNFNGDIIQAIDVAEVSVALEEHLPLNRVGIADLGINGPGKWGRCVCCWV